MRINPLYSSQTHSIARRLFAGPLSRWYRYDLELVHRLPCDDGPALPEARYGRGLGLDGPAYAFSIGAILWTIRACREPWQAGAVSALARCRGFGGPDRDGAYP